MDIKSLGAEIPMPTLAKSAEKPAEKGGTSFADALGQAVGSVRDQTVAAENTNAQFANANDGALHENMIALEKANVALKLMVSVRNKALDAYRELTRTT